MGTGGDPVKQEDEVKQSVQKQFGRNAEKYVQSESHAQGDDLPLLVEWLQPQPNWVVLDIATGGGHVARVLSPHCGHVVATDLTRPMLEAAAAANRKAGAENLLYVVADAESLPFLAETFDAVTCRIAPHHFPDPDAFVGEVSRVLRPGGLFVLIDNVAPEQAEWGRFMNQVEKLRDDSHVRCLSVSEWRDLLVKHGFDTIRERQRKKSFAFPTWVRRTAQSEEQVQQVEQVLLRADQATAAYFAIQTEADRVLSHQIDEWMVLCRKRG
jgi:ubiquinone/menaquinone biosynthesis C-methylase UbiE